MVRYLFYTIGDLTYQSPLVGFLRRRCSLESLQSTASADFSDLRRNKSTWKFCIILSFLQA